MEASKLIDQKIASLADWRGEIIKAIRTLIHEVDPEIVEEWKWMGTPAWNHDGIVCIANAHKNHVKVTFHKGAKLRDPQKVFNAELEGNAWRAIDLAEGDKINAAGFKGLIRDAIALNREKPAARKAGGASSVTAKVSGAKKVGAGSKAAAVKKAASAKKAAAPKKAVAGNKAAALK
jgi:hypothetical protein